MTTPFTSIFARLTNVPSVLCDGSPNTKRLGHDAVGCYVDNTHSIPEGTRMVVMLAKVFGWNDEAVRDLEDDLDFVEFTDLANEVTDWLNENVASDGYAFGWHDGEFMFMTKEWWSEQ